MSIAIVTDGLAPCVPPAGALPAANPGLPTEAGAADASSVPGTPFDAALQACLIDLPLPENVEGMAPGQDRVLTDESVAEPSSDETQAQTVPSIPALLTALLPSVHAATWLAPSGAATSEAPPEAATARFEGAVAASANELSRLVSLPVGMDVGAALMSPAGQPGGQLPKAAVRSGPVHIGALSDAVRAVAVPGVVVGTSGAVQATGVAVGTSDAVQAAALPDVAVGTPGAGLPKTEPAAAAAVVAAMQSTLASEGGRGVSADGVERGLPASVLPTAPADPVTVRSADAPLRLPNGDATQWRQPLMQALGERLQFASARGVDSAVIRLEPPRMGSIEIAIRHQDGALQINLSATHNEVLRQLQDISDSLRHTLGQRHAGDVTVQVAEAAALRPGQGDGERQRQRQAQSEQDPGRALGDTDSEGADPSFRLVRNEE